MSWSAKSMCQKCMETSLIQECSCFLPSLSKRIFETLMQEIREQSKIKMPVVKSYFCNHQSYDFRRIFWIHALYQLLLLKSSDDTSASLSRGLCSACLNIGHHHSGPKLRKIQGLPTMDQTYFNLLYNVGIPDKITIKGQNGDV